MVECSFPFNPHFSRQKRTWNPQFAKFPNSRGSQRWWTCASVASQRRLRRWLGLLYAQCHLRRSRDLPKKLEMCADQPSRSLYKKKMRVYICFTTKWSTTKSTHFSHSKCRNQLPILVLDRAKPVVEVTEFTSASGATWRQWRFTVPKQAAADDLAKFENGDMMA